jgi:hypothetical protein
VGCEPYPHQLEVSVADESWLYGWCLVCSESLERERKSMIKIVIERKTTEKYTTQEQLITKETPTDIQGDSDYGTRKEVKFIREYAVAEMTKYRESSVTLLQQEIINDSAFNLAAVIIAINGLEKQ